MEGRMDEGRKSLCLILDDKLGDIDFQPTIWPTHTLNTFPGDTAREYQTDQKVKLIPLLPRVVTKLSSPHRFCKVTHPSNETTSWEELRICKCDRI